MNKKYSISLCLLSSLSLILVGCPISTTPLPTATPSPTAFEPPANSPAPKPQKLIKKPL